jgi:deltex-like protein
MVRAARSLPPGQIVDANTVIGDKLQGMTASQTPLLYTFDRDGWPVNDSYHEIVLRSSAQCLPMVKFDRVFINHEAGRDCIGFLKHSLELIINRLFNKGSECSDLRKAPLIATVPTRATLPLPLPQFGMHPVRPLFLPGTVAPGHHLPSLLPPPLSLQAAMAGLRPSAAATTQAIQAYTAAIQANMAALQANGVPVSTNPPMNNIVESLRYTAPRSLAMGVPSDAVIAPPASCNGRDDCTICFERLNKRRYVALKACNHVFHHKCIQMAIKSKPQCPVCRVPVGASPQGKSPSGAMTISISPISCSGFRCDSLVISYNIPAAYQLSYHDNPGQSHSGKVATAYLPNNEEGKDLLKRLKFAFMHGLSFSVGTSLSSGLSDQCTW